VSAFTTMDDVAFVGIFLVLRNMDVHTVFPETR